MVFLRDVRSSSLDIFSKLEKSKELGVAREDEGVRGSGVVGDGVAGASYRTIHLLTLKEETGRACSV